MDDRRLQYRNHDAAMLRSRPSSGGRGRARRRAAGAPRRANIEPTLTAVPGIKVGHHTLTERPTGCTVDPRRGGATAGVDVRGAAPATRETDLLEPGEHGRADQRRGAVRRQRVRPRRGDRRRALARRAEHRHASTAPRTCRSCPARDPVRPRRRRQPEDPADRRLRLSAPAQAATTAPVQEGTVGAGAGATRRQDRRAGARDERRHRQRRDHACRTASSSPRIVAVNAVGDIIDPGDRQGRRRRAQSRRHASPTRASCCALARPARPRAGENTTIGVVATNAKLTKAQAHAHGADGRRRLRARDLPDRTRRSTATRCSRSRPARWTGAADIATSARSPPKRWPTRSSARPRRRPASPASRPSRDLKQ